MRFVNSSTRKTDLLFAGYVIPKSKIRENRIQDNEHQNHPRKKQQTESGSIWDSVQKKKAPKSTNEVERDATLPVEVTSKPEQVIPHDLLVYDTYGDLRRRYPDHDDYIAALERERDARRNRRALKIAHK